MNENIARIGRFGGSLATRHLGLLLVLGVALAFRLVYLRWFKAFPPGDVFNFVIIAQGIPEGFYPPTEKRLPLFPLLLLLAHAVLDWEVAAVAVAVVASLASLVLLYGVGRTLGISKTALAAGLLLFQGQPAFLVASSRGYADTMLIALVLGGLLSLLRACTTRGAILTGALFGAAALTRYEGLAAALVALPLWTLLPRKRPRRLPVIASIALLLTLTPYAILALRNHRPLIGAGYFAEAEETAYGTANPREVLENARMIWERVGLFGGWKVPIDLTHQTREEPLNTARILQGYLSDPRIPPSVIITLGAIALVVRKRLRDLVILGVPYAALTVLPAWYEPYPRYDIFILPLATLLFAAGLSAFQRLLERGTAGGVGRVVRYAAGTAMLLAVFGLWTMWEAAETKHTQAKHNGKDYAYYQAIQAARKLPGNIAFEKNPDIIRIHFGKRAVILQDVLQPGESPEASLEKLRERGVTYLVLRAGEEARYRFLGAPAAERAATFEWEQGDHDVSRATIHRLTE